jgi:aerobic-type carbon monoxide dehydrogenase small subunit (CoxS/CutS family)
MCRDRRRHRHLSARTARARLGRALDAQAGAGHHGDPGLDGIEETDDRGLAHRRAAPPGPRSPKRRCRRCSTGCAPRRGRWAGAGAEPRHHRGNLVTASPAGDGIPNLLALDAEVEIAGPAGTRRLPLADSSPATARRRSRPDEIVTALHVPRCDGARGRFEKLGARRYLVISIAMAAAVLRCRWRAHRGSADRGRRLLAGGAAAARAGSGAGGASRCATRRRAAAAHLARSRRSTTCAPRRLSARRGARAAARPAAGPGGMIAFTLNGAPRAGRGADPFAPLSDTLREGLGLTGTKVGCDAGDCGACTVLMDGAQVCACLVRPRRRKARAITTVEAAGPAARPAARRLPRAWRGAVRHLHAGDDHGRADLLRRDAAPDRAAVEDALGGVLCRCTGYLKIVDAVLDAAPTAAWRHAGRRRRGRRRRRAAGRRAEGRGDGTLRRGCAPADALWLRVVRSPHAHARFTLGDLDAARQRLGLVAILTACATCRA